jgi:hypothetical protein
MKHGKKIKIKGIPVELMSDAEAEKADFVVCMPVGDSPFDDNLTGFCCKCGIKVMYRWHAPRKPAKICLECCAKEAEKLNAKTHTR